MKQLIMYFQKLFNFLNPWYQQKRYNELVKAYILNSDSKQKEINYLRTALDEREKVIKYYQDWFTNPKNYPQGKNIEAR